MIFLRILILLLYTLITVCPTLDIILPARFGVPFSESMNIPNMYLPAQATKSKRWQRATELYNQHIVQDLSILDTPRIPTIIHQIWLGSPLPENCKILQKTWLENHPHWLYLFWTDTVPQSFGDDYSIPVIAPQSFEEFLNFLHTLNPQNGVYIIDISNLTFSTQHHFKERKNYGEKSDILRYEILFYCGGLYIDTDFECLRPIDVFHYACDFYIGAVYDTERFLVHNSLIAARARHPIINACVCAIQLQTPTQDLHTGEAVMARTGPYQLTNHVWAHMSTCQDRTVVLPMTYFHPWPHTARFQNSREKIEKWIKPESYGIHHWHVSWLPKS